MLQTVWEKDDESVHSLQTANTPTKCIDCQYFSGSVELAVDYCGHPTFNLGGPEIDDAQTILDNCPLNDNSLKV